ncbi:Family S53 protease-like protein [Mycena kentingensis (nom. inval.)]|nr:Family S53 protease-like protein [Mycena kentingensis (nom. inval.)]
MSFTRLLGVLSFALSISAASLVVHEHRKAAPAGFTSNGAASDKHMLTLRFGLASNNMPGLHEKLLSISTPGSADFRKWLSTDEIKAFVAPTEESVNAFDAFAAANGLTPSVISPFGEWRTLTMPVSQANKLFAAKFTNYTHADLPAPITRTLSISLPSDLAPHIDVVHPSTAFTNPSPRLTPPSIRFHNALKRDATAPAECDTQNPDNDITPACLQALYNIPTTPAAKRDDNALLVTGYVQQWAQIADLQAFLKQFRPDVNANQTFLRLAIDGGTNPQFPNVAGIEADLDVEYAAGIATDIALWFLTVGGFDFPTALLDTTTFLATSPKFPTVVTTSYGDAEENFGPSMATKICDGYAAATARGMSILFASGDGGVSGNHDDGVNCGLFIGVFPASCPWITSVGSTIGFNPEVAVNFTGGGFSNIFPQPSYQTDAVTKYLDALPEDFPGNGIFNATGRGYPDLSLQGWNFLISLDGQVGGVSGTSASSPSVAAMIALVNDQLLAAGKPVLGFLNPFLYANPGAFNDITEGHNSGFSCDADTAAFDCSEGWDPLSGMGTPDYARLLAAAMA